MALTLTLTLTATVTVTATLTLTLTAANVPVSVTAAVRRTAATAVTAVTAAAGGAPCAPSPCGGPFVRRSGIGIGRHCTRRPNPRTGVPSPRSASSTISLLRARPWPRRVATGRFLAHEIIWQRLDHCAVMINSDCHCHCAGAPATPRAQPPDSDHTHSINMANAPALRVHSSNEIGKKNVLELRVATLARPIDNSAQNANCRWRLQLRGALAVGSSSQLIRVQQRRAQR